MFCDVSTLGVQRLVASRNPVHEQLFADQRRFALQCGAQEKIEIVQLLKVRQPAGSGEHVAWDEEITRRENDVHEYAEARQIGKKADVMQQSPVIIDAPAIAYRQRTPILVNRRQMRDYDAAAACCEET